MSSKTSEYKKPYTPEQEKIPYVELLVELIWRYGVFAKTNPYSRVKIFRLWLGIEKLTREKYAGMHADTDNEVNNFWQKLSYGFLERHRRYVDQHLRDV